MLCKSYGDLRSNRYTLLLGNIKSRLEKLAIKIGATIPPKNFQVKESKTNPRNIHSHIFSFTFLRVKIRV